MFFKNKIEIYSNRIPVSFLKDFVCKYPKNLPSYFKNIPKTYPFKVGRNFNIWKVMSVVVIIVSLISKASTIL